MMRGRETDLVKPDVFLPISARRPSSGHCLRGKVNCQIFSPHQILRRSIEHSRPLIHERANLVGSKAPF
jgi:hypothetical protein